MGTDPTAPNVPPTENNLPSAQPMATEVTPREEVRKQTAEKPQLKRAARGLFTQGTAPGPGRPKGRKDNLTIIHEAKVQLLADIFQAQPTKRFYKKWLKNYAVRHPKEALELISNIDSKLSGKEKTENHLHINLADLVERSWKSKDKSQVDK